MLEVVVVVAELVECNNSLHNWVHMMKDMVQSIVAVVVVQVAFVRRNIQDCKLVHILENMVLDNFQVATWVEVEVEEQVE